MSLKVNVASVSLLAAYCSLYLLYDPMTPRASTFFSVIPLSADSVVSCCTPHAGLHQIVCSLFVRF